jgi:ubiquitin-protein ligase E3 C
LSWYGAESIDIRREFILEDALDKFLPMGDNIKNRVRIQFIDENYMVEEGVDGGGLFKEFMTKLTEKIFDPHYAFFSETQLDRKLYPNHLSQN